MILLGIDPGIHGALCAMDHTGLILAVSDIPTLQLGKTKKASLDYHQLSALIVGSKAGHAFVEKTWNRPGEGHSGILVGVYMAILATLTTAGVPWTAPPPQVWKKALQVPAVKDGARARASQLMPGGVGFWPLKQDHGRAEAALIAYYGVHSLAGISK